MFFALVFYEFSLPSRIIFYTLFCLLNAGEIRINSYNNFYNIVSNKLFFYKMGSNIQNNKLF